MKNANIFVDVDMTIVDHNQELIPGVREGLQRLVECGCHLFLWSTAGGKHAKAMAAIHGLTALFEGFSTKPDIVIDDMPGTVLNPFVFNPNQVEDWRSMVDEIIEKHID